MVKQFAYLHYQLLDFNSVFLSRVSQSIILSFAAISLAILRLNLLRVVVHEELSNESKHANKPEEACFGSMISYEKSKLLQVLQNYFYFFYVTFRYI